MAKSALTFVLLLAAVSAHAADQSAELFKFAKANQGKFATELKDKPGVFSLRVSMEGPYWAYARYVPDQGLMVAETMMEIREQWVFQRCKAAGSFNGQNAYGATANVALQSCERLEIADTGEGIAMQSGACQKDISADFDARVGGDLCNTSLRSALAINMTPDQYRDLKRRGALLDIEFTPGEGAAEEVVSFDKVRGSATVRDPVQRDISVWTVRGKIQSVTLRTADGKHAFGRLPR